MLNAGPNLNLVLAPNGTGKSALVCSIIIGLGGDPSTTGRAGHLGNSLETLLISLFTFVFVSEGEYIRFGCDSALIEIELYNERPNDKNFLIQRVIHSRQTSGKTEFTSSFKLNGKESNRTHVRDFVKSLNINVDNLCQFLPQERVIEFVKMDRKTLLECTEKAAGNEDMFASHQKIVELTKSLKKLNEVKSDLSNQITTETELQTRAEEELRRIEERDRFKDEIEWLEKKKPWIEYEDKRVEYTNAKEALLSKKEEVLKLTKSLEPLKVEANTSRSLLNESQIKKTNALKELKDTSKQIEPIKRKIESAFDEIKDAKSQYFEKMDVEKRRHNRMKQLEEELNSFCEQFENINEDNTDVEQQIKQVLEQLNRVNADIIQQNKNNNKCREELENLVIERNRLDSKRKNLEDVFRRRLDKLRELNLNAAKAYEWLSQNKNRFKANIYPPIMTQINMKRIDWSKYVESAISKNDLIAFICEDRDDLKLFTQLLQQELNIRVNVVLAPNQSGGDFQPDFNVEEYSVYGIFSTISDMFTAPDKVMAYLCKNSRLHQIPVGDHRTDEKFQDLVEKSNFRRVYTNRNVYNINVSRYDKNKVINSDAFPDAKFLNLAVNETELQEIRRQLLVFNEKQTEVKAKCLQVDQKLADLNFKAQDLKDKKKLLDNKKNEKRILETKISEKREQIAQIKRQAIDLEEIKRKTEEKLKKLQENQLTAMDKLTKTVKECVKKNDNKIKAFLNEMLVRKRTEVAQRKFATASEQFQGLKDELKRLEISLEGLKREAKELRERAKDISGFDVNSCDEEVRQKFDSLPNSVDDIDNQIGTLRLRMNSILDADESVRDTYNQRQKAIEKRRKDLESRTKELADKQSKLEELKSDWLPSLEQLIAKINENFGNFMARINCAGDVSLYKSEDPVSC